MIECIVQNIAWLISVSHYISNKTCLHAFNILICYLIPGTPVPSEYGVGGKILFVLRVFLGMNSAKAIVLPLNTCNNQTSPLLAIPEGVLTEYGESCAAGMMV